MSTAEELVKYCSTVHMKTLLPNVLVVDELEYYLGQLTVSNNVTVNFFMRNLVIVI